MRKYVLLVISGIFILSSICIVIGRVLIPISKNKKIKDERIYYSDLNQQNNASVNTEASDGNKENEVIKIETTDSNIATIYVGSFMSKINGKKYDEAYAMLATNFKNINFPTQADFEKYWTEKYNDYYLLKYTSIERAGIVILAEVNMNDYTYKNETIKQVFTLIKEDKEYKISFGLGDKDE